MESSSPAAVVKRYPHEGRPHRLHSLLEWRVLAEVAFLPFAWPMLSQAPQGDGHPVLLLPGFMADEATLVALKMFLAGRGYNVQSWGMGRNVGFQRRHADALEQKVRHVHHQTGRKVSLVGWSLGGVFALYAAHQAPECVRQIITLGSPVTMDHAGGSQAASVVKVLYRMIAHPMGPGVHVMHTRAKKMRQHEMPQVPMSCLYSLSDGVVPPQEATVDGDASLHENIRVAGSHIGLGFNAMVMCIVADRLALPEGQWRPFQPEGLSGSIYRLMTHDALPL